MTASTARIARPALEQASPRASRALRLLRDLVRHRQGLAGLILVGALVLMAILAPVLSWHAPDEQFRGLRLTGPSGDFIFGTDEFSRDIWARVLYGLRTSLMVGVLSVVAGALAGSLIGLVAGYVGGVVDTMLSRVMDALLAFPAVVMAIAVATALGRGNESVGIAIAIFNVPLFARLARSAALVERRREYIQAARAVGATGPRMLFIHIVPNTLAPLLVQAAFSVSFSILLEAGLSFLGLGTVPPAPSIGGMLNTSRTYMRDAPWYPLLPGTVIVLLLVGLNFLADAINDLNDPRRRRR
jgi:peptide/nickel transport system permease protein